jgi:hypothetical protein
MSRPDQDPDCVAVDDAIGRAAFVLSLIAFALIAFACGAFLGA